MASKKLTLKCALLVLMLLSVALSGCSPRRVVLYPISDTDFWIDEKKNVCMSEWYFNEVLKVELENK